MIALAYILAAALVGTVGLIVWLTYKVVSLSTDYTSVRVTSISTASELKAALANLATQTNRADSEEARANALDELIATHLDAGPVNGAFERLRVQWQAARLGPANVTDTRQLPAPTKAAASSDLMRPGE